MYVYVCVCVCIWRDIVLKAFLNIYYVTTGSSIVVVVVVVVIRSTIRVHQFQPKRTDNNNTTNTHIKTFY